MPHTNPLKHTEEFTDTLNTLIHAVTPHSSLQSYKVAICQSFLPPIIFTTHVVTQLPVKARVSFNLRRGT